MSTPFWRRPKSKNVQLEHWLHSLDEVEKVVKSVEPKLMSTSAKWKGGVCSPQHRIVQNCKEISTELCQIFNKNDPNYEVLLGSYTSARKFEDEQHQITKINEVRDRAVEHLKAYLTEIQQLKAQSVEEERVRSRLEHYKLKVRGLEKKGNDQAKLERNIEKLQQVELQYRNFTWELTRQMEVCWKKHVKLFAEACIALWYTEFSLSGKLFECCESVRPFISEHLQTFAAFNNQDLNNLPMSDPQSPEWQPEGETQLIEERSPVSEEDFGMLNSSDDERKTLLDQVWRMSSVLNSSSSSNNSYHPTAAHHYRLPRNNNTQDVHSVVSQSPGEARNKG
eukprot:jgi/Galph1/2557/GphlegSOOS_G1227.1